MMYMSSFPNLSCLLLIGVYVAQTFAHTPIEGSYSDVSNNLENIYCKFPQSYKVEDSGKCSSAQKLFSVLSNCCFCEGRLFQNVRFESNVKEVEKEKDQVVVTEKVNVEEKSKVEEKVKVVEKFNVANTLKVLEQFKAEQKLRESKKKIPEGVKSRTVDLCVLIILLGSMIVSLLEWYRESRRKVKAEERRLSPTGEPGRRMSIADLTVNRHMRRLDKEQADALRPNQGSRPPLKRRSSFPTQIPNARYRNYAPQRQQSIPSSYTRRMSIDLEEDSPPRRVRLIRRH